MADDEKASSAPTRSHERSERREQIKLYLEFIKTAASLGGLATIVLAFMALKENQRNESASRAKESQDVYRLVARDWNEHLSTFVEQPQLRPYFFEKKDVVPKDPLREKVKAVATVRIDLMDAMLMAMRFRGWTAEDTAGWQKTFDNAFANSPEMCNVLAASTADYGIIVPTADNACRGATYQTYRKRATVRP